MQAGNPSGTARRTAVVRAIHMLEDRPAVFDDPLAVRIVGGDPRTPGYETSNAYRMRGFVVSRSRIAEEAIAAARARGVRRIVILGAGLDTYACRAGGGDVEVIEVDHPATQAWKQAVLRENGIAVPAGVRFVPIDFEHAGLRDGLAAAGVRPDAPTVFSWLGVSYYIPPESFRATLAFVRDCGPGSEIVFDFMPPQEAVAKQEVDTFRRNIDSDEHPGEPFISFYRVDELGAELHRIGFSAVEMMDNDTQNARYFAGRADDLRVIGGVYVARARV
ncbi:MAG: class I SAM-dependent methyltransferase [Gammaproteobacteria bacterium]